MIQKHHGKEQRLPHTSIAGQRLSSSTKMKNKKDGLVSKVVNFKLNQISRDENKNRYIPYCDYHWHRGLIQDENVCEIRRCRHYHRMYISNLTKKYY